MFCNSIAIKDIASIPSSDSKLHYKSYITDNGITTNDADSPEGEQSMWLSEPIQQNSVELLTILDN